MSFDHHPHPASQTARFRIAARRRRIRSAAGFSLIEVMVVVVIIGMLAGAVALSTRGYIDSADRNRARSDLATIVTAVETFYLEHRRYPTNDEGLDAVNVTTKSDPWKKAFLYNSPGPDDHPFEVYTLGKDGREGGRDADEDLYSWQLGEEEEQE